MARVLIGIVGYCHFVRGYPLGPELMDGLRAVPWPEPVEIRELNWGPIAIVQDLQASAEKYERVVLVGAAAASAPGTLICHRWSGRVGDLLAVQRRVFEAVTGVISVDNLLVIGAHFGVWPEELLTVEVGLPATSLGDLVLAEAQAQALSGGQAVIGEQAMSADALLLVRRIVDATRRAAMDDADAASQPMSLATSELAPVATVCHYDFRQDGRVVRPPEGQEQPQ